jgi:serine/threonine protein kinase
VSTGSKGSSVRFCSPQQKLVHRDIKPGNIMVSLEEGGAVTAKIIDLGLAKPVNEPGSQTAISTFFAGTPEFASPEQFAGVGVKLRRASTLSNWR